MLNPTHSAGRRSVFRTLRVVAITAMVALAMTLLPASSRADGDPASDVLLTQTVFVPWDAGASATQTTELRSLLLVAARHGYPARVALIASASDLGSVTELWRQPQTYADFLGLELSQSSHGTVIVVMPNGVGAYRPGVAAAVAQAALARARAHAGHGDLAAVASAAVQSLAAADGHALPTLRTQAAPRREATRSTDAATWLALGLGAVLIALAWTASLRARPARLRRRHTSAPPSG